MPLLLLVPSIRLLLLYIVGAVFVERMPPPTYVNYRLDTLGNGTVIIV